MGAYSEGKGGPITHIHLSCSEYSVLYVKVGQKSIQNSTSRVILAKKNRHFQSIGFPSIF